MAEPNTKRQKMDEKGEDEALPPGVEKSLMDLEGIQSKLDEINDEALEKVFEVERVYNKKRRPVYEERQKVLSKVPQFWQQTLLNHHLIRQMVTDDDIEVLQYCTELDVEEFEDIKSGYKITLRFDSKNPFFSEPQLVKEFHNKDEGEIHVRGNVPTWKPGMTPEEGAEGEERPEGREYRLMMWFVEDETLSNGGHDPLADIVKDQIWPNPLKYYNNEDDEDSQLGMEEDSELGSQEYDEGAGGEVYEEEGGENEEGSEEDQGE